MPISPENKPEIGFASVRFWTAARRAQVAALDRAGHSYAEIAEIIGRETGRDVTRNAIGSQLHQHKLRITRGASAPDGSSATTRARSPSSRTLTMLHQARLKVAEAGQTLPPEPVTASAVSLLDRRACQCAWPLIDEAGADRRGADGVMLVCGAPTVGGSSWCSGHHGRAKGAAQTVPQWVRAWLIQRGKS